jgi:IclR family acetate operon transcriptional repressor
MARPLSSDQSAVKSALRTLEILELFRRDRRALTVGEIASELGYPQSSTSALIQTMIGAGYLVVDGNDRRFLPTQRVAELGAWLHGLDRERTVRRITHALGDQTGQTIVVGIRQDIHVRYTNVLPGRHPMRLEIPPGSRLPLVAAGMGILLLSAMADEEIVAVLARMRELREQHGSAAIQASEIAASWNANPIIPADSAVLQEVRRVRRRGYSMTIDGVTKGAGIIGVLLPREHGEPPVGVGVGGLSSIIARDKAAIVKLIHEECGRA